MRKLFEFLVSAFVIISIGMIIRQFPNLMVVILTGIFALFTYLVHRLSRDSHTIEVFARQAHPVRVLFFGTICLVFFGFMSGLTWQGVYVTFGEFWSGNTILIRDNDGVGKRLPAGLYNSTVMLCFITTMAIFFSYIFFSVLMKGSKGLRLRLRK